jgi:hypothetical protein
MAPRPPHATALFLLRALRDQSIETRLGLLKKLTELPAPERVEVALQLLEVMDAKHGHVTGSAAACVLREDGTITALARLRATRGGLPEIEGLRDWRWDVDQAIESIENRAAGRCACHACPTQGTGPDERTYRELSVERSDFTARITLACRTCGRECVVERDDSYHYPTFRWI